MFNFQRLLEFLVIFVADVNRKSKGFCFFIFAIELIHVHLILYLLL
jgi:hypothetical protein